MTVLLAEGDGERGFRIALALQQAGCIPMWSRKLSEALAQVGYLFDAALVGYDLLADDGAPSAFAGAQVVHDLLEQQPHVPVVAIGPSVDQNRELEDAGAFLSLPPEVLFDPYAAAGVLRSCARWRRRVTAPEPTDA